MMLAGDAHSARAAYNALAVTSFALIGVGLWLQHAEGLEPCPLCIFQRIAYLAVGVFALLAAWLDRRAAGRWLGGLVLLSAVGGAGIAGRHVWLQSQPAGLSCGPGLQTMLENFPLTDVLPRVFRGSGDCAEASWSLIGLTIAQWSLLWFVLLSVAALALLVPPRFRPLFAR